MSILFPPPRFRRSRRNSGIALIIVLAVLVLITGLVVGFLVRSGTEVAASGSYSATTDARLLAETAVNVVQAQINEATTSGATNSWASQPGAVRVFDNTGQLQKLYRLYSASSMTAVTSQAGVGALLQQDVAPADWATSRAIWVDLNAPVKLSGMTDATGNIVPDYSIYPIIDPRDPTDPGPVDAPKVTTKIPGFGVDATKAPGVTSLQPVPMPVRWLYVLQSGMIVAPTGTGRTATLPKESAPGKGDGASAANPIVGRIAFWTDDETAKVNINTAAGSLSVRNGQTLPSPWDTPRFRIWEERMLFSENQPVHAEYQRYPGHPATTDLYGIMSGLGVTTTGYPPVTTNYTVTQPVPDGTKSAFFQIMSRYADDYSSRGGIATTTKSGAPPAINGGVAKQERLYSSVGELLYNPQRNGNGLARQQLESGKFFLTAHSRAPEVNLFGAPRIAMWPIDTDPTRTTTFDKLIAFCATTGTGTAAQKHLYYFQRHDARSATNDYDNIARNQDLYRYLRNLTSAAIPGFGGNFNVKYASNQERDQVLTEMLDYIRCTNLFDHSKASTDPFVRFTSNPSGLSGGKAQVVPLKIVEGGVTTHGLGRIQTISEIGLHLICTADGNGPAYQPPVASGGLQAPVSPVQGSAESAAYVSNLPVAQFLRKADNTIVDITGAVATSATPAANAFPANPTLTTTGDFGGPLQVLQPGQKRLQAELLFELACPMMGFDPMDTATKPSYKINVSGIQGINIAGQNPFPNQTPTLNSLAPKQNGNGFIDNMSTRFASIQGTGGILGFRYLMLKLTASNSNARYNGWSGVSPYAGATDPYRYVSNPFTVSGSSPLALSGTFTAEMHVPISGGTTKYQTFSVAFPALSNMPQPDLPQNGLKGSVNASPYTSNPNDWWGFDNRIAWGGIGSTIDNISTKTPNLAKGCVIRSDVAPSGTWSYTAQASVPLAQFNAQPASSDVVRTLVSKDGDYRLTAAKESVDVSGGTTTDFAKGPGYDAGVKLGNLFKDQFSSLGTAGIDNGGKLVGGANYSYQMTPKVPSDLDPKKQLTWDWDNGLPQDPDGAYSGKPDEGNIYINSSSPYYNRENQTQATTDIMSYFTANRIVSSPVMFGSLPTGVTENITWRTLLFRPQANRPLDATGPKDHLLLDLFNMPVVEPYAISEPFSTAGKVNMNYQIVPFTYITRNTGVRAVLGSELLPRVPKAAAAAQPSALPHTYYKVTQGLPGSGAVTPPGAPSVARLPVNLEEKDGALRQFKTKFDNWEIFKSASEICDIYLVPQGYSWTSDAAADAAWYGDDFALVGDNARERPYSDIYPRLTTKSNTFTVHYTVQALKNPGTDPAQWDESRGVVTGEHRGSTTLERYIDPANPKIPDYATDFTTAPPLDTYYQWRVVATNAFSP